MHRIHWEYTGGSEFFQVDRKEDEYYDSWNEANNRVRELVFDNHQSNMDSTRLTVFWYDEDDEIEPLYRVFECYIPDRG